MPLFFKIGKPNISTSAKNQLWTTTTVGEKQATEYAGEDTPMFRTLASINTLSVANIESIANDTQLKPSVVEFQLRQLKKAGFIKPVKSGGD